MEHRGREVRAYRISEVPNNVVIDVLQKDGDCPRNLTREKRLNCPLDCDNTFVCCL